MVKCIICGSEKKIEIPFQLNTEIVKSLKKYNINQTLNWYLCQRCGNSYQFPKQDKRVLSDSWNKIETGTEGESSKNRKDSSKRIFNYFSKYLDEKKSILDVGCGHGYLLKEFKDVGFDVLGVDVDKRTKEMHNRLGIESIIGRVEDINLEKKYDVVFSINSIYFIQDPVEFLTKIKSFINNDGYLCITMANFLTSTDKSLPSYNLAFYPNYDSIEYILALSGYKIISKEIKLSNILLICEIQDNIMLPKINYRKIFFLIRSKNIRYYLLGLPLLLLYKLFKGTFISKIVQKIVKY